MASRRMDPRAMRRLMDRMGVKLEELGEVAEVVFRMTLGSELVIQILRLRE